MLFNDQTQTTTQGQTPHTKKTALNFLQTNLGRSYAAHDIAYATALQMDADILIASEPNKKIASGKSWICDNKKDVAVKLINSNLQVQKIDKGEGTVTIHFANFDLVCCYISPNCSENVFTQYLNYLTARIRAGKRSFVVAGDFNAKSPMWGSPTSDRRGDALAEAAIGLGAVSINERHMPTFVRGKSESYIDVTFLSEALFPHSTGWTTLDNEPMSHHKHIFFKIQKNIT